AGLVTFSAAGRGGGGSAVPLTYALIAAPSVLVTCTVGTEWKSAFSEFGLVLASTMPTPPASLTARLLSTRSLVPRSQTTILPATAAGSRKPSGCAGSHSREKHSRTPVAFAPGRPTVVDSAIGLLGTAAPRPAPL